MLNSKHTYYKTEGLRNFAHTPYEHPQNGQTYNKCNLTKDGFLMLVMGFKGKEALKFKMMYIDEFNRMEQELNNRNMDSFMIADPIARAEKLIR